MSESFSICEMYGVRIPTVSVIISCFNKQAFIERAIRSVAAQQYRNLQCVVVDDVSTDGTVDRVNKCLSSLDDNRFRFIEREENGGQMASMLTGLDNCTGAFVAFVDGDDTWHPEFLDSHLQAHLSKHGVAAISCSDMIIVEDQGTILAGGFPPFRKSDPRNKNLPRQDLNTVKHAGLELTFVRAGHTGWIWSATSGMMFRRQLVDLMRPDRPEEIRICADDYWARAAHMLGGTVRIDRALGSYCVHANNGWAGNVFVGELLALGAVDKGIGEQIEMDVAERICSIWERVSAYDSANRLAKIVIQMLGIARAFRLCGQNQQAYNLLWEHLPKANTRPRRGGTVSPDPQQASG